MSMNRIVIHLFILLAFFSIYSFGFSTDQVKKGGLWHFGLSGFYSPQAELNKKFTQLGYKDLNDLGIGMTFGGGGLIHDFFIGGWGSFDFNSTKSINTNTSKTLFSDGGGRGGVEFGYYINLFEELSIIPSISLIWGGRDYSFSTNVDFTAYLQNPSDFGPSFGINHMSVGAGLSTIININNFSGVMLRVYYLYSLQNSFGSPTFLNTPKMNEHSVTASIEFTFQSDHKSKKNKKDKTN